MNHSALCALQSFKPHPMPLRRLAQMYAENCVLNILMSTVQSSFKSNQLHLKNIGIFENMNDALWVCKENQINTLYIAIRHIPEHPISNCDGICIRYL